MFAEFRSQYPQGSIQTEMLPKIDGMHTFRATITSNGTTLATAMGVDADLETAEDRAIKRALVIAGISENYRLSASLETDYNPLPALAPQKFAPPQIQPKLEPDYESAPPPEAKPTPRPPAPKQEEPAPIDLSDYITRIDVEMERVGWDRKKGKEYIVHTFNKQSRQYLTQEELALFLKHLRAMPSATSLEF